MTTKEEIAFAGTELVWTLASACKLAVRQGSDCVTSVDVLRAQLKRVHVVKGKLAALAMPERTRAVGGCENLGREAPLRMTDGSSLLDLEVAGTLNEAYWRARQLLRYSASADLPVWSSEVVSALRETLLDAKTMPVDIVSSVHLTIVLLLDDGSSASRYMRERNVSNKELFEAISAYESALLDGSPNRPSVLNLTMLGVLDSKVSFGFRWLAGRVLTKRVRKIGPIMFNIQREAVRHAIRLGDRYVGVAHVLLGICAMENQLCAANQSLPSVYQKDNLGGSMLAEWGISYPEMSLHVEFDESAAKESEASKLWPYAKCDPMADADAVALIDATGREARKAGMKWPGSSLLLKVLLRNHLEQIYSILNEFEVDVERFLAEACALP